MRHLWRRNYRKRLAARQEHPGPLRVMFVHTEVVVGGAETLLAEIIRNMDRERFEPELCCLKELAELGEVLAKEIPTHVGLLHGKYDWRVLGRLTRLFRERNIDAVVTVGTGGDRMFWGRLAAWRGGLPVILSALHSTGHPQQVEAINRYLAPITDGFIGCAQMHAEYLICSEGCPRDKTFAIYNGVDTERFQPADATPLRAELGWPDDAPTCGIVAALRPEKQHVLLVKAFRRVVNQVPNARLVIVGDGSERTHIEKTVKELELTDDQVLMMGTRHDVERILPALDVKVLASRMEANPASTLEAAACGLPVIAPGVGSIPETVRHGVTGLLYPVSDEEMLAAALTELLSDRQRAWEMGCYARELVCSKFSLAGMVHGYENLIQGVYDAAVARRRFRPEELLQMNPPLNLPSWLDDDPDIGPELQSMLSDTAACGPELTVHDSNIN